MNNLVLLILINLLTLAQASPARAAGFTELGMSAPKNGLSGDAYIQDLYFRFLKAHAARGCAAAGPGRHIMITGFGRQDDESYNISGTTVEAMADERFWPAEISVGSNVPSATLAPKGFALPNSSFQHTDAEAKIYNRSLKINGSRYEVCFVVTAVLWDFAPAVVIHEALGFKPELILMTGRGATTQFKIEGAATNHALKLAGFIDQGSKHGPVHWWGHSVEAENLPQRPWVLESYPTDSVLPMSWNARALAQSIRSQAFTMNFPLEFHTAPAPGNLYICNNLSFAVLNASLNQPTVLAGSLIILPSPQLVRQPVVGFIHLPPTDIAHPHLDTYRDGVWGFAKILATIVASALEP